MGMGDLKEDRVFWLLITIMGMRAYMITNTSFGHLLIIMVQCEGPVWGV